MNHVPANKEPEVKSHPKADRTQLPQAPEHGIPITWSKLNLWLSLAILRREERRRIKKKKKKILLDLKEEVCLFIFRKGRQNTSQSFFTPLNDLEMQDPCRKQLNIKLTSEPAPCF